MFGGTGPDGLCSMAPRVLDTITLQWRIASLEEGGEGEEAMPPGRHRAGASASHCGRFLLVHGGCPPRGQWLRDTWVLDLEALEWRPAPLQVRGRQLRHSAIAGHTMEGMVAFGGCFRGLFGIMPVAKVDMLLLGPAPPPVPGDRRESHRRRREGTLAELEVLGQVTLHGETMQVVRHPRHGGFAIPMHMFDSMMEAMAAEEDEDEEEESQEGDKDDIHSEDNAERVEAEGGTGGIHSDGGGEEEGRGEDADPPVLASHPLVDLTDDVSD